MFHTFTIAINLLQQALHLLKKKNFIQFFLGVYTVFIVCNDTADSLDESDV